MICHLFSHHPVYPAVQRILAVRCGSGPSCRGAGTDALVCAPQAYDYMEVDEAPTAEAFADIFNNAPNAASVRSGGRPCGVDEGADTDTAIPVGDQSRADCEAAIKESTWGGYDARDRALIKQ